jgi:hypothetical protein
MIEHTMYTHTVRGDDGHELGVALTAAHDLTVGEEIEICFPGGSQLCRVAQITYAGGASSATMESVTTCGLSQVIQGEPFTTDGAKVSACFTSLWDDDGADGEQDAADDLVAALEYAGSVLSNDQLRGIFAAWLAEREDKRPRGPAAIGDRLMDAIHSSGLFSAESLRRIFPAQPERAPGVKPALAGLGETAPDLRYRGMGFCAE